MAKPADTWEGRRALTDNPNTSSASYQNAAARLMELDQLSEAAVFYGRAENDEGLLEIMTKAAEEGNFFIFQAAASRLKEKKPQKNQVETLIASAEKAGFAHYAEKAAAYLKGLS